MNDVTLAGIFMGLFSLVFSKFPFIQLVYVLSMFYATNWTEMGMITVAMLIATIGANLAKSFDN